MAELVHRISKATYSLDVPTLEFSIDHGYMDNAAFKKLGISSFIVGPEDLMGYFMGTPPQDMNRVQDSLAYWGDFLTQVGAIVGPLV